MDKNLILFFEILTAKIKANEYDWSGRYLSVKNFGAEPFRKLVELMATLNIQKNGDQSELIFDLNNDLVAGTLIFFEKPHFVNGYGRYQQDFDQKDIVVLLHDGDVLIKERGAAFESRLSLIFNYSQYRAILSHLLANTDFVSLHSENDRQFIILSAEKGKYHIGYNLAEVRVESLSDLAPLYAELVKNFEKIEFVNFFKDVVINGTHLQEIKERFWAIVTALGTQLSLADRDLQIYVRKFAFDKIKSKFKEEKVKYFESLEKNIEALNKQVVTFPLTFAASAFAGFQVKDNPWILMIIVSAYALYTWLAWRVLGITGLNIHTTKEDVEKESDKIKTTYNFIFSEFEGDFKKINDKISLIERLHKNLRGVLIALLVLFVIFSIAYGVAIQSKGNVVERAKTDSLRIARYNDSLVHAKDSITAAGATLGPIQNARKIRADSLPTGVKHDTILK